MASITKNGKSWRVQLYAKGKRESASFHSKAEAALWALERTAELRGAKLPSRTLDDALARYGREKGPTNEAGQKWTQTKIRNLRATAMAKRPLADLTGPDIAQFRDERLSGPRLKGKGSVAPSTVNRELNLLRSVLEAARRDWGWLKVNPMADVKRPKNPRARRRRITDAEIAAISAGLGYKGGPPIIPAHYVALAFQFAIETAMRGGEILRLQWAHVGALSVHLPKTKNGDARDVPLSSRAREILSLLPRGDGPVFALTDARRGQLFAQGRKAAAIGNLHFHDSRAEAIFRLSKRLDVMELARMIGHRNLASLMHYYETTADELAAKLG